MFQDRAATAATSNTAAATSTTTTAGSVTSTTAGSAVVGIIKGRGKVEDDPFTIDR